jgi:hypothetical protein
MDIVTSGTYILFLPTEPDGVLFYAFIPYLYKLPYFS